MYLNNENEIVDSLSTYGHPAIAIPGTIDVIFEAHKSLEVYQYQRFLNQQ